MPKPTKPGPTGITPTSVIAALGRASDAAIPYGDPADDRWIAIIPGARGAARVFITDGDGETLYAAYDMTITPAKPARPTAPDGMEHARCPSTQGANGIPHPGHVHDGRWCDGQLGLTTPRAGGNQ